MPTGPQAEQTVPLIREVEFLRDKYGPELLVDVGWVRELDKFNKDTRPHRLHFYDILLVTEGRGTLSFDGRPEVVAPGRLLFTSPGQVRSFDVDQLEGVCLFFVGDFLQDFFSDPLFLYRLQFFHPSERDASLTLTEERRSWLTERLETMRSELTELQGDSGHLLRAILYEVLVTLNRWSAESQGTEGDTLANPSTYRFLELVERRFRSEHRVAWYARELGLTPGHLSTITRRSLGRTAGTLIRDRLTLEAKRRLLYSDDPAAQIARDLGFEDASYFGRFFRRCTGLTPGQFRGAPRQLGSPVLLHNQA